MQVGVDGSVHTVIVTVTAGALAMAHASQHAAEGLSKFAAFPGYIAGATHLSADGGTLIQYTQWRSEPEFQAAIADPIWQGDTSSERFMALVRAGDIHMQVAAYSVTAAN